MIYISVPMRNIRFVLSFYMLASKSRTQYGSIDTSNTNICLLVTILWQNTQEQQNISHSLPYLIEIFIAMYGCTAHLYILECSTVQCSPSRPALQKENAHNPTHRKTQFPTQQNVILHFPAIWKILLATHFHSHVQSRRSPDNFCYIGPN